MDFIVKLPVSYSCDMIWVICDRLTHAAHFIPTFESLSAPDLAFLFLSNMFKHHGLPQSIISDRGSVFISQFWQELMHLIDVKLKPSTAYHPQMDGLTERKNQTLKAYLQAYCSYQQDDWVDYLALAEFAFNNLVNSLMQQTPFFANLGYHPTFKPRVTEQCRQSCYSPSTYP
jgi:transposase InsO family protein